MDAGASTSAASIVTPEQLEKAKKDFAEAMDLRDADPGAAVRLFDEVLRTRVAHFGEMAIEVAPVYMRYGMSLFEQAQLNQDYFGDKVQTAAAARDAAARGEGSDGSDIDEAADEDNAQDGEPSTAAAEPAEADQPSPETAAAADQPQQPEEAEDADDMQVAWENLELARIIYEKHGGAEQHASDLAEIHNYTGDIYSEQEKFEEAIDEYNKCINMLGHLPKEDKRRVAQVYFKQALAQQFNDQHQDALNAITTARTKLTAHRDALHKQLADLPAPPAAANAAAAAFAAAIASFAPPPPAAAAGGEGSGTAAADQAHEAAAKASGLRKELGDIAAVLEDLADKADELRAAIATQASMKDALRSAMRSLADAEQLAPGGGVAGAGAGGDPGSSGNPAAAGAAQVQDLGVVGKGKRVAPVPVPATPAAAAEAAAAANGAGAASSDKAAAAAGEGGGKEASTGAPIAAAGRGGGAPKRSLEDLMGGGAAGGSTTVGFGASKVTELEGAKKLKPDASGDGDQGEKVQQVQEHQ